jgi:hypothetical protein
MWGRSEERAFDVAEHRCVAREQQAAKLAKTLSRHLSKRHWGVDADWLAGKRFPEDRETILKRLGFDSYETYLLSALWRRTRRWIFQLARVLDGALRDGMVPLQHYIHVTEPHVMTGFEAFETYHSRI